MLAIPFELSPDFPTEVSQPLLITANAARDEGIIEKMKGYLRAGGQIVMTSSFVARMSGRGAEEFTTLHPTGKKLAVSKFATETHSCTFDRFSESREELLFPILDYSTNGTWQSIVALKGHNNIPVLMYDNYSRGRIHTLVIPDDYADLWKLPEDVALEAARRAGGRCRSIPDRRPRRGGLVRLRQRDVRARELRSDPAALDRPRAGRPRADPDRRAGASEEARHGRGRLRSVRSAARTFFPRLVQA
ncbi:hypothetical protein [Cohnella fermenti]|uniref:Beta-galactosidase trimerisation domain-containing protein n=1 Tax=Cohnella fermenti TaxID=2565925 RepID=A0A4S4BMJ2_9BACL|nr:hypothetical protein [Cohnella fermenti]THF75485.1 hypothetical protein E6C55_21805 [Cohnella fermenti]